MARRWPPRVSISFELIGFTAIAVAAITGILSWYFQSQHIAALVTGQNDRARIYGDVLSNELRSAVAFSDRETAREVLRPLAADADVASTTLFGASGAVLYTSGTASAWVRAVAVALTDQPITPSAIAIARTASMVSDSAAVLSSR